MPIQTKHSITAVHGHWLRAPVRPGGENDDDPSREVLIVEIHTACGLSGLGECNHHPAAAHAFFHSGGQSRTDRGVAAALLGRDPRDHADIGAELQQTNFFSARRGIGWAVLSAVDMALWDLSAQIEGVPLWHLLWGQAARPPRAYLTLYTGGAAYDETLRRFDRMTPHIEGFRAVKIEPLIDCVPEDKIGEFARFARERLGADVELLVDFGYRMPSADRAISAINACAPAGPLAVETPCPLDPVQLWNETARASSVPLAGAELAEHPDDYFRLMDAGVKWLQPWANRLGVTGACDVITGGEERSCRVTMAGWNATGIGVAASVHLGAGIAGPGPHLEFASRELNDFPLRAATKPELRPKGDIFELPSAPGLGVKLDRQAMSAFIVS